MSIVSLYEGNDMLLKIMIFLNDDKPLFIPPPFHQNVVTFQELELVKAFLMFVFYESYHLNNQVIYRLLGVCTEDIVADYQTSYTYNKKASDKFMNEHPQFRQYRNVVLSEAENMYAVLNLFDELDLESYLISKGANKEKLEKLRRNMLVEL